MLRKLTTFTVIAIFALAGCAGQGADTKTDAVARECFSATSVRSFTSLDATTVQLQTGRRDVYELKLFNYCPEVDWSQAIALRAAGGSSLICTGDAVGVEVVVLNRRSRIGPDGCRVRSIRKLEPAEIEAQRAASTQKRVDRAGGEP